MTTRAFIDSAGIERLVGTLVPDPGGLSNPIVVSVPLEVDQTDATKDDLLIVKIPATYVNDSNKGWLIRAGFTPSDPDSWVFAAGLDKLHFKAAAGEGDGQLLVGAEDRPNATAAIGTNGLTLRRQSDATVTFEVAADGSIGFYGAVAVPQQTGVAVTAAALHAALVNLGLITA